MYANFDAEKMDILLLLVPPKFSIGYDGNGDYIKRSKRVLSVIKRKYSNNYNGLVFTGWQIIKRELFEQINVSNFSLNLLFDSAENKKKLFGITHRGEFLHMSTPKSFLQVEQFLNKKKKVFL